MKKYWLNGLCVSLLWLSGCESTAERASSSPSGNQEEATQVEAPAEGSDTAATNSDSKTLAQKSADDSSEAIENDSEFFVIDVRSAEEFTADNVDGSINIPHTEILEGIKDVTDKMDAKIYFY